MGKAHNRAETHEIIAGAQLATAQREHELKKEMLAVQVGAFCQQMSSLQPELISSLKTAAGQQFTAEVTKNLSPLAILGGESVSDVIVRLLKALPMGITPHIGVSDVIESFT